ncbi:MAG TPA: sulfur transferase domain-containing protein [Thermoanaerobaculia bacterium]|nr:sulfur transferase domain-containing protein [Thermoanaerobaculia bacterium]
MSPAWKCALLAGLLLATPVMAQSPGLGITNAVEAEPGLLITGQPTAAQIKAAGKAGYHTVIDLRSRDENRGFDEEKVAGKAKMAYTNVEVTPDTLTQSKVLFFLMMLREAERPAILHCSTGNRAGALYYSWLVLEKGVPEDQALTQAQAAGLRDPLLGQAVTTLVADIKKSQRPAN